VNGYRYTVDEAVLHAFATVRKKHRERLLGIFDQLLANPFLKAIPSKPTIPDGNAR
jgi:hypothetical protein